METGVQKGRAQQWNNKAEFILTLIGMAVGLGNVWRFPYVCYKNGGGAFLIPYFTMLLGMGIPLFFLEISLGQFSSRGPIRVWDSNPALRGVGFSGLLILILIQIYYPVVVSYCTFYFFGSMKKEVPWKRCMDDPDSFPHRPWVSDCCRDGGSRVANLTVSMELPANLNINNLTSVWNSCNGTYTVPSEDYLRNFVLQISNDFSSLGGLNWELSLCLVLSWLIIFLVLSKGVQSLGKVAYFASIFPYFMLTILLVKGLTLPGAWNGISFYLRPQWHKLLDPNVWRDAAVQIFYSVGVGSLGLLALSSYNNYKNNVLRDAILVPIVNSATSFYAGFVIFSVLGYVAHIKQTTDVGQVVDEGPALAFIVYPEGLAQMGFSSIWAILFFFMMCNLGFSSLFGCVEAIIVTLLDQFPRFKSTKLNEVLFRFFVCACCCIAGLTMCTKGGFYVLNLLDQRVGGFPLLIMGFAETVHVGWIYGFDRFSNDVSHMLGHTEWFQTYWKICWKFLAPFLIVVITIASLARLSPLSAEIGSHHVFYPAWAEVLGWLFPLASLALIFFMVIYETGRVNARKVPGQTFIQTLKLATQPLFDWGPVIHSNYKEWKQRSEERFGFLDCRSKDNFANNNVHMSTKDYVDEVAPLNVA